MFFGIINWFIGSRDYFIPDDNADKAAALLVSSGANFRSMKRKEDGLYFSAPLPDCKPIERIFNAQNTSFTCICEHGVKRLIRRYRRRFGIPIGIGMFLAILWLSEQFIWSIEVIGNENVSSQQILASLDELGCGVGTYIPKIDFDRLHTDFLLSEKEIAWIAVNVRGTYATVEVREIVRNPPVPDEDTPYNLIAAEDGIVTYIEVHRGTVTTEVGTLVRKGELLASGISETPDGFRMVHARGKVLAEVKRDIKIEVPLDTVKKVETGNEIIDKSLKILGFSLKLFGNTGNLPEDYDKIEREHNIRFFDMIEIPVAIHETVYREYGYEPETLTEEEARAEAFRRLRAESAKILEVGELISREIKAGFDGKAYVIECRLGLIANIAVESEIYR
jgi:similar to stage IV sporulation protein